MADSEKGYSAEIPALGESRGGVSVRVTAPETVESIMLEFHFCDGDGLARYWLPRHQVQALALTLGRASGLDFAAVGGGDARVETEDREEGPVPKATDELLLDVIELADRVSAVRSDVKASDEATSIEDETAYLLEQAAGELRLAYERVGEASKLLAARVGYAAAMPEVADVASG